MLPGSFVGAPQDRPLVAPQLGARKDDLPNTKGEGSSEYVVDKQIDLDSSLRQDVLLAGLDIPHRGFVAAKKGAKVEFKASRRSKPIKMKVLGSSPSKSSKKKSRKKREHEVVLKRSSHRRGRTSSRRSGTQRRETYVHPWGPEAQGLPEVNTLAGDTATLTKSWNTSKKTFSKKASKQKKKKNKSSPTSVFSSVLRLEEEELGEDFETHNIRLGIEDVRRKPLKMYEWKTPYDIDAPRNVMIPKNEKPSRSSSGSSSSIRNSDGRSVEQKLWDGIESLIADAFSDDDSRSHMSALAEILPTNVFKALSEKSVASDSPNSSSKSSSRSTPSTGKGQPRGASSVTVPDEIEAAQMALNSFMELLVPKQTTSSSQASLSYLSSTSSQSTSTIDLDQIALAEVALNNFMDVLLTELERDLKKDVSDMDPEQLQQHRRRSQSKLTLFEVFRWSLQVNIDAVEKMKYIKEHPEVQLQLKENQQRAQQQASKGVSTPSRQTDDTLSNLPTVEPSLESSFQPSTTTSEELLDRPEIGRTPSWAAIGGMPLVMSSPRRGSVSKASSPESQEASRLSNSAESTSSNVLPSSFLEGANNLESGESDQEEYGFPFRKEDVNATDKDKDRSIFSKAALSMTSVQRSWRSTVSTSDVPDLASISSESSLLSNIGLMSMTSSASGGMPELASIGEHTAVQYGGFTSGSGDNSQTSTLEPSLSEYLESSSQRSSYIDSSNVDAQPRSIQRSLSDDYSEFDSVRTAVEEFGSVLSSRHRWEFDVISVGEAGDVHGRVGSVLHVVHRDRSDSYVSNSVQSEEVTLDSDLFEDVSHSFLQHQNVPELNQSWSRAGRRRLWFTSRLAAGLQNARERGRCLARSLCRPAFCPSGCGRSRYRQLQNRQNNNGNHNGKDSDESSRHCLMHGMDDRKFDRFPVFEETIPDIL